MKTIKVGVVGVGSLGRHHARVYSQLSSARLEGVADIAFDRAQAVAQSHGCGAFSDYRSLLDKVEAVSLAVPTESHVEIGLEALQRGVHVLVEKPIAPDLEGADQLTAEARNSKAVLHVGHIERYNPVIQAVLESVTRPQFFEAHRLGVFVPRSLDVDVILDLMIHDLDLVLWLVRDSIKEIRAVGIPVLTPRVDIANVRLEFEGGCVANLTASRVSREKIRKLRFFQPHDYVSLDFHQKTVEMYSLEGSPEARRIVEKHPRVSEVEPLRVELEAFLSAVSGEQVPMACSGEEARKVLAAALEIVRLADAASASRPGRLGSPLN